MIRSVGLGPDGKVRFSCSSITRAYFINYPGLIEHPFLGGENGFWKMFKGKPHFDIFMKNV